MKKPIDRLIRVLKDKKTVVTRAIFWRIPHNSDKQDVCLKIGRYKKPPAPYQPEEIENADPKSELTLDLEELNALIQFLEENYEPFKAGTKAFIPLDKPFEAENAEQIKALFALPEQKEIIEFILQNNVIPEDLRLGLEAARRVKPISYFQKMLNENLTENPWQKWFEKHSWVLGSEFVKVLDERQVDTRNITDFLLQAYDGFLDIVELKRPEGNLKFWNNSLDHGNYVPSSDLIKAITQASKYIFEVEREANSVKFLERVNGVRVVKPRAVLIFGRSNEWNPAQMEAYRILNAGYSNLTIMSYDHVLERAKRIVGLKDS